MNAKPAFQLEKILSDALSNTSGPLPDLGNLFRRKLVKKGDIWLRPGQTCRYLAYLESGMFRAYVETDTGSHTRWAFLPRQFFTSISSFGLQRPSEEYIVAVEDTVLHQISFTDWKKVEAEVPALKEYWTTTLLELCHCYESRLHSLLIGDAEERYKYLMERFPEFILQVPQKYVAEMLGIAPRHLSRIRKSLAEG